MFVLISGVFLLLPGADFRIEKNLNDRLTTTWTYTVITIHPILADILYH